MRLIHEIEVLVLLILLCDFVLLTNFYVLDPWLKALAPHLLYSFGQICVTNFVFWSLTLFIFYQLFILKVLTFAIRHTFYFWLCLVWFLLLFCQSSLWIQSVVPRLFRTLFSSCTRIHIQLILVWSFDLYILDKVNLHLCNKKCI